ncbi:MAG: hypothetical protein JSR87_12265 [Proteobacteria bacterium]|nr:hypothetical protein [Pseudomonadota bacterium]MBS0572508.1 hypothetical protein [Pseudomonadota bacterium]
MANDLPTVLEIIETELRPVFLHEATGFTRWLFLPENLAWLGRAIDMELLPVDRELNTGTFRLDILARDAETDQLVVIENQFARSDHDHLGKTLSYLAATDAKVAIWLAESFADEHRAALEWLNDHTPADVAFWAVVPRMLRVGDGPPGLRFEVAVRPNRVIKAVRDTEYRIDPGIAPLRERYWTIFKEELEQNRSLNQVTTRHGGRQGHLTLYPDQRFEAVTPRINVLAFLSLSGKNRAARLHPRPNPDEAPPDWQDRIAAQRAILADEIDTKISGDWDSDDGLREIARRHLRGAQHMLEVTADVFGSEVAAEQP